MATNQAAIDKPEKKPLVMRWGKKFLRAITRFQGRHSLVSTAPILDPAEFPWVSDLEAAWPGIRAELDRVLVHPEDLPPFHVMSPDQARISKGDHWKTFGFCVYGNRVEENCALCPYTTGVIDKLPGMRTAFFSVLDPGYYIPPHRGPTRAVIRCHLALKVPREKERCWIRVGDQVRHWTEGQCLLLDDTYEHEVHNDTDELRVVLFLDIDRPSDRIGTWFNRTVIRMIAASRYIKEPMKNVARWNRARDERRRQAQS